MRSLISLSLRLVLITLLTAIAAYFIPTGYILRAPGHADDLTRMVYVHGGKPHPPGRLFMTTVVFEKANVLFCMYSLFEPHAELLSDRATPQLRTSTPFHPPSPWSPAGSPEQMMEASKDVAAVVALRKLGYDVRFQTIGARVVAFLNNVPAANVLHLGDVICGVDGQPINSVRTLKAALRHHKPGDTVKVDIRRDNKTTSAQFVLVGHEGAAIIGILTQDAVAHAQLPVNIQITTQNVNGASAGLMFTLEIIDQLTPGGITHGQQIAGTGTIESNGTVGPIEGTELKEIAAQRAGATVFIVPAENYAEVRGKIPSMTLIKVKTLDDALNALKKLTPVK